MLDAESLRPILAAALGSGFELGGVLGQGGFAIVFRARDLTLHRDVAVKVLTRDSGFDEKTVERFQREARTIASLEHANIVPVYQAGASGDALFIVMRLIDGRPLSRIIEERGALPWREAVQIATRATDGLAHAHARGVVHRDIKPDNLLLDAEGNVLVSDFGIARTSIGGGQLTAQGMVSGTPRYMSPEQALGDQVDARSDVYSLGIVLYEMLTGHVPFSGASAAMLQRQLTADAPPIDTPGVPAPLRSLVARALDSEPEKRFADAGALRDALVAAQKRAEAPPPWKTAARIGGVAALAALVMAGVLLWNYWVREQLRRRGPAIDLVVVPDSVTQRLRAMNVLGDGERIRYVFAPAGSTLDDALVLTDSRFIRTTPQGARSHPVTDFQGLTGGSGSYGMGPVVLVLKGRPLANGQFPSDTLFHNLGERERTQLYAKLQVFNFAK